MPSADHRPLRVLHVIDSLDQGGAEQSLVDLLPSLLDRGIEVEVALLRPGGVYRPRADRAGVPVHVLDAGRLGRWRSLRRLLVATRPDLVHATLFEANLVARLAAVSTRTPVVTSLVGTPYGPDHRARSGVRAAKVRAVHVIDAATARSVRRFHANAEHVAVTMSHRLRLDRGRIDVIPRGRDPQVLGTRTGARRAQVRATLGLDVDTPVVLVAARHEPPKGIDLGIRAFATCRRLDDGLLLIAGRPGSETGELGALVDALGIAARVRFLGERDDVADLMAAADALLLPSRREGFPGVLVEAMALELPVVAFDVPGVGEAIADGAYLAPPGDVTGLAGALDDRFADAPTARRRAEQGRARFEADFTTPAVAAQMVAFYERALGGSTGPTLRIANVLNRNHRRGAEAFAHDLGRALAERSHDVHEVALRGADSPPTLPVPPLAPPGASLATVARRLRATVGGSDVVIGHGGQTLVAGALATRAGPPFVYRVIGEPHHWVPGAVRRRLVARAMGRASRVVVYYPEAAERLHTDLGVDRERIVVLPKGIDTTAWRPATADERRAARRRLGLDPDDRRPVVLYVGALVAVKNLPQLVGALDHLDDAVLVVVGDGPERDELARTRAGRDGRLVLVGALDDPTVAYHAADVVALTSRSEGVPTVLLEAALAGLPAVATDVGGIATVVDDGITGHLVPVDDPVATAAAIVATLADRDRLGGAARQRCLARHDIATVAAEWEAMLREVPPPRGRRRR